MHCIATAECTGTLRTRFERSPPEPTPVCKYKRTGAPRVSLPLSSCVSFGRRLRSTFKAIISNGISHNMSQQERSRDSDTVVHECGALVKAYWFCAGSRGLIVCAGEGDPATCPVCTVPMPLSVIPSPTLTRLSWKAIPRDQCRAQMALDGPMQLCSQASGGQAVQFYVW